MKNLFKLFCNGTFILLVTSLGLTGMASAENFRHVPFREGEELKYAIKKFGLKAGEASLVFNGKDSLGDREVYLITFTAKAMNFFDEEKIYIDPETFYPVRVQRDLDIWGKKEKIVEDYLSDEGLVKIVKQAKGKTEEQVIQKENQMDNIYCFIYRFRMNEQAVIGDSYLMYLPTKDVTIKLKKKRKLKNSGKIYETLYLESDPKKYRVWFDTSAQKIPLRIDGAAGMISTTMVLEEHKL